MLYHYYMKINFKLLLAAFLTAGFIPGAMAQVTVVKQDGKKIYLDTSTLNRNVSVGETFKIITGQEKLTNPKTGKELGLVYQYSQEGKIIEVQPLYAVGELPQAASYEIGSEAVITPGVQEAVTTTAPAPQTAQADDPAAAQTPAPTLVAKRKIKTYPVLEHEIISAVKADLNAFPGEEIAALDAKGHLLVYTQNDGNLQQMADYKIPANKTPITLSALDIMQSGYAQLFAVVYDTQKKSIVTLVLDGSDKELKEIDSLPYFVKELGCDANKKLYAQKPFISGTKAGDVRLLKYAKGKFSSAPNRVKYKQDIISFYPSLQVYGPAGKAVLAAVENTAKFGILSESFGSYKSSKLHFLTYENGVLDVRETIDLNGFLYDTNCTSTGILAPQVVSGGQTVLTEIYR